MEQSSSSSSGSDYMTVWSAPPKKPSGRTKFRETRHPIYRGVRRRGTANRWVCEVRNPSTKSRIWLGTFPTADMAARAHDVAAMVLQGRSACLNFPDSAWLITVPSSFSSVKELKKVAVVTAEMLHSGNSAGTVESASSSASSTETADEMEVASSSSSLSLPVPAPKMEADDQSNFRWDGFEVEDMNFGTYFASLAEGLMLDPPAGWFADLDDDNRCITTVSLWS